MAERNGTSRDHADNSPQTKRTKGWTVPTSNESKGAVNSIRQCEEQHFRDSLEQRDKTKDLIKLSIGNNMHSSLLSAAPSCLGWLLLLNLFAHNIR